MIQYSETPVMKAKATAYYAAKSAIRYDCACCIAAAGDDDRGDTASAARSIDAHKVFSGEVVSVRAIRSGSRNGI
jgi:hypothetical protein